MKHKDDLFQLVKSLEQTEKRYFRLDAGWHTIGDKNNYLQLFEIINQQKKYDEQEVRRKLHSGSSAVYLAETKYYLQKQILKSLHRYHAGSSVDAQLNEQLHLAEVLQKKGLIAFCLNVLEKAKKKALYYEKFHHLIEITKWENDIFLAEPTKSAQENKIRINNRLAEDSLEKLKVIGKFRFYNSVIGLMTKKQAILRNRKDLAKLEAIIKDPLFRNEKKATSYEAKVYYLRTKSIYYFIKSDFRNSSKYGSLLVKMIESRSFLIRERPGFYISALHNYVISLNSLKHFSDATAQIKKMRETALLLKYDESFQMRIFTRSLSLELHMCIEAGEFKKGVLLVPGFEKELVRFELKMDSAFKYFIYYEMAYLYFGVGEYSTSLRWLNKILSAYSGNVVSDIYIFTKIMHLIAHFELKNYDILKYLVKSIYRLLRKKKRLYKIESILLAFIRNKQELNTKSKGKNARAFEELRQKLLDASTKPSEQKALSYFDFISWLESKITNRPFAEVVKGKVKHTN